MAALKTLAHGVVGGLASAANGGSFKSGFAAAGFTEAFSGTASSLAPQDPLTGAINPTQVVIAATIGGTGSVIGGGKFANGAITGAFSNVFNQQGHCSGRPCDTRDAGTPLSDREIAGVNGIFSQGGALLAGYGCLTTTTTCGLAVVLQTDAIRQFRIALTGQDFVSDGALKVGLTSNQAAHVAMAANFGTAAYSIRGIAVGVAQRFGSTATSGSLGAAASFDAISGVNSVRQLRESSK